MAFHETLLILQSLNQVTEAMKDMTDGPVIPLIP